MQHRGQLEGVFIVDAADTLRFRLVRAGRRVGGDVEILAGLGEGDRIVTSALDALKDGQPAKVAP